MTMAGGGTNTNTNSTPPHNNHLSPSRKAVVAGRWKLLRDALRGKPVLRQATFAGYQMIESRRVAPRDAVLQELSRQLCHIELTKEMIKNISVALLDVLETSVLGLQAIDYTVHGEPITQAHYDFFLHSHNKSYVDWKTVDFTAIAREICRRCKFTTCTLTLDEAPITTTSTDKNHPLVVVAVLRTTLATSNHRNLFLIQQYTLPGETGVLWVRERSPKQVISLAELTSHHQPHEIDNTGNVCVWDCEKTLLWALLLLQRTASPHGKIVELGAGMAGLVALGLAAAHRASHVIVTDGNPGSVQSNRTHVRLMENFRPFSCPVDAQLLPWALQTSEENETFHNLQAHPADVSVVSDCTHFERYHGHLLWTLIQCTAVKGQIWMCHPNRGKTLKRFLDIVRLLAVQDETDATNTRLLSLEEVSFPELDQRHELLAKTDEHYRPNVHRPRIFYISKHRVATENDRQLIIHHMATRDDC